MLHDARSAAVQGAPNWLRKDREIRRVGCAPVSFRWLRTTETRGAMVKVEPMVGRDAVMVLPGIMGSELVEVSTGRPLWGLANVGWYARAWVSGTSLDALRVTEQERAGQVGRVAASRLLRFPAAAPVLRGFEPYAVLLAGLRRVVPDRAALLEFPYDWRLSVEYNAGLLAAAAERHLERWRGHPQGSRDARLVLVAHSLGGLVARYFTGVLGGQRDVRAVVTLGTPFYGSVKTAHLLSKGRGAPLPLPHARLRALGMTLPGLHDLLPSYRCVDEGVSARCLTATDVAALGGDRELAAQALVRRERLLRTADAQPWAGLRPLVGVEQDTMQSVVLTDGVANARFYTCLPGPDGGIRREDRRGDGTVYREAACPVGVDPLHLPQTHGALACRAEGVAHACAVITNRELGPWLAGVIALGLKVPDVVTVGQLFEITVTGCEDPAAVMCRVIDAGANREVARPLLVPREDQLAAWVQVAEPGIYRVEAKAGGLSSVTELVLALGPQEARTR